MHRTLLLLAALFTGFGLLMLGSGLGSTLLALRMGLEDFSLRESGYVMAAYAIGFVVGPLILPRLIHRIGHIRGFAGLAVLGAIGMLLHVLAISPLTWFLLRMMTGLAIAGLLMLIESWLNFRTVSSDRGRVLSAYMIISYLGFVGGQFFLNLGSPESFELFIIAGILLVAAVIPVSLTRLGEPDRPDPHLPPLRGLWSLSPLGLAAAFTAGLVNTAFTTIGPLYALEIALGVSQIAEFLAIAVFAGLIMQWPLGWLSDRLDRRFLILGAGIGIAITAFLMIMVTLFLPGALLYCVALYGGMAYPLYPLALAHANDMVTTRQSVHMAAALIIAFGLGSIAGPLLATQVMMVSGPWGLFLVISMAGLSIAAFALWRALHGAPTVPVDERSDFLPAGPGLAETTALVDLDPRTETGPAPADPDPDPASSPSPDRG